jgi:hypothetical protein
MDHCASAPPVEGVPRVKEILSHENSEFVKKGLRRRQIHNRFTVGTHSDFGSIAENQVGGNGGKFGGNIVASL